MKPDWKFLSIITWLGLLAVCIAGSPFHEHVWKTGWSKIFIYCTLPFWCAGLAGNIHYLVTVPLLTRSDEENNGNQ